MRVTIGIPAYNQGQYLREAIESALNQTYKDTEIIVVNDGSTDETASICWEYGVNTITQVNKGLASARNTAIMAMMGDLFLPLDADDILEPNCVERIVEVAKHTNADIIAPSIHCFGLIEQDTILIPNPTLEDFKVGNRIAYCSAIKRSALIQVGGYSPKMIEGFEDYHLWVNLLTRGKTIVTIPEPLVKYRIKEKSMITEANKHKDKLMAQIYKDFPKFV